jgi:hypothetical protein
MVGFFKGKSNDERRASDFVRQMFELGRKTCHSVAEAVQMTTSGDVSFPLTDDSSLEVSLAIIGTSLAILKGNSKIMSRDRGTEIETWCKQSIERDYDLPLDTTSKLIDAINEYQEAFEKAMQSNINPFGEISGIMLSRSLGPRVKSICLNDTTALNPFVHQVVGDVMTMTITKAMTYWKD